MKDEHRILSSRLNHINHRLNGFTTQGRFVRDDVRQLKFAVKLLSVSLLALYVTILVGALYG